MYVHMWLMKTNSGFLTFLDKCKYIQYTFDSVIIVHCKTYKIWYNQGLK